MRIVTPFRDGMEDDVGVDESANDHAYQEKPQEGSNDAPNACSSTEEITE